LCQISFRVHPSKNLAGGEQQEKDDRPEPDTHFAIFALYAAKKDASSEAVARPMMRVPQHPPSLQQPRSRDLFSVNLMENGKEIDISHERTLIYHSSLFSSLGDAKANPSPVRWKICLVLCAAVAAAAGVARDNLKNTLQE
jgi:hypothetical protein